MIYLIAGIIWIVFGIAGEIYHELKEHGSIRPIWITVLIGIIMGPFTWSPDVFWNRDRRP